MTKVSKVVFLLDADNTLLNQDFPALLSIHKADCT
jgi:hypothetical protein